MQLRAMSVSMSAQDELRKIAESLVAPGKGILAADEPLDYMGNTLGAIGLENSEESRRCYRQVLFTTDKELGKYISGIILHPETVPQKTDNGILFVEVLKQKGIIAGVNVDQGLLPLCGTDGETITQGLDELHRRCQQFKAKGCHFAKWRCALKITKSTPSALAVRANAEVLARYASVCQDNRMVPIVEPEVQLEGDHDLERAQKVTETVLAAVYKALNDYNVFLEGTLLKPSMVTQGSRHSVKSKPEDVARATVTALARTVPAAVPGIGFLSGGQTDVEATENLLAINKYGGMKKPWALTFIFGRALQAAVPRVWAGKDQNVVAAQQQLLMRAKANSKASMD